MKVIQVPFCRKTGRRGLLRAYRAEFSTFVGTTFDVSNIGLGIHWLTGTLGGEDRFPQCFQHDVQSRVAVAVPGFEAGIVGVPDPRWLIDRELFMDRQMQ